MKAHAIVRILSYCRSLMCYTIEFIKLGMWNLLLVFIINQLNLLYLNTAFVLLSLTKQTQIIFLKLVNIFHSHSFHNVWKDY